MGVISVWLLRADAAEYVLGVVRELEQAPITTDQQSIVTDPLIMADFYIQSLRVLEKARHQEGWWSGAYVDDALYVARRAEALSLMDTGGPYHHYAMCQHLDLLNKRKFHWQCVTVGFDYAKRFYNTEPTGDFKQDMKQAHQRALLLTPVAKSLCYLGLHAEANNLAMECTCKLSLLQVAVGRDLDHRVANALFVGSLDLDIDLAIAKLRLVLATTNAGQGNHDVAAKQLRSVWEKLKDTKAGDLLWWACSAATLIHEDNGRVEEAVTMDVFLSTHHPDVYKGHPDALRRGAIQMVNQGRHRAAAKHLRGVLDLFKRWPDVASMSIPDPDLNNLIRAVEVLASIYIQLGKPDLVAAINNEIDEWRLIENALKREIGEATKAEARRRKKKSGKAKRNAKRKKNRQQEQKRTVQEEDICAICLDTMDPIEGEYDVHTTACQHRFHTKCITEWAENKRKKNFRPDCPNCRKNIDVGMCV